MEKKAALKHALCAARGTVTKFDQVASFWQEFVLEPEERERQEQRRIRKAKAEAMIAKAAADAAALAATDVEGLQVFMLRQNQFRSQDDSSISARHLLLHQHLDDLHVARATETTAVSEATSDPDR